MAYQSPVLEKGFYPRAKVSILCHKLTVGLGRGFRSTQKGAQLMPFEACLPGGFSAMTVALGSLSRRFPSVFLKLEVQVHCPMSSAF